MSKGVFIQNVALAGYRSFGPQIQRFERFGKVNLFIGQNNSGKSNILSFLHKVYPLLHHNKGPSLGALDRHLLSDARFIVGGKISLQHDQENNYADFNEYIHSVFLDDRLPRARIGNLLDVFKERAAQEGVGDAWFYVDNNGDPVLDGWNDAFSCLDDYELKHIWSAASGGSSGGGRETHWVPRIVRIVQPKYPRVEVILIPAIRKVGDKGTVSDDFSGEGIIERLVKLQNPGVHDQGDRAKFEAINDFLKSVTDNSSARLEIPHEKDTIVVHMDGKSLPLESLGTGIHEVIILASAATILENTVVCMEEPELHLNPLLQKKLVRYLEDHTNNQYFITTHSAALMDTPGAEVYHISLDNGASIVSRVTSDSERSAICEDLGYHPSDLLQSNCVIWVEGPSDRIYLNWWISAVSPEYVEGIHYSIMFYGGRLASHLTGEDFHDSVDEFISLRRINRRGVIVIDSDRDKPRTRINGTKKRLKKEFDEGPGFAWITEGREIENYISPELVKEAVKKVSPSAVAISGFGKFDNCLSVKTRSGKESHVSKVKVAHYICGNYLPDMSQLDLNKKVEDLARFIKESNPVLHISSV